MSIPDKCPVCGSKPHLPNPKEGRWFFECGTWMKDGDDWPKEVGMVCYDRRKIKDAAAIIRGLVDEEGNAMSFPLLIEKAKDWLKDNAP